LKPLIRLRYWGIIFVLLAATTGLIWRMLYLTTFNRDFLQEQGDARTLRMVNIPAYRGMIRDRNGEPLAISTPVDSIWINPQDFDVKHNNINQLASILNLTTAAIKQRTEKIVRKNSSILSVV
jgi:cell division protein FtsI (penicillin-binding protein 3)